MVNRFLARCLMSQSAVPNESEDQTKSSLNIKTESEQEKAITCSLVPEKEEPHGFIKLAAEIFELLDRQLLCSKNRSIKDYLKRNLSDQEIVILTSILKDLDKELSRPVSWFVYGFLGTIIQVCNFITKGQNFYSARYLTWIRRPECCPLYKYAKSSGNIRVQGYIYQLGAH